MSLRPRTAFHRPSAATVGSLSRRGLIAGGVGIGAMFALAACSGGGSDAGSDALESSRSQLEDILADLAQAWAVLEQRINVQCDVG